MRRSQLILWFALTFGLCIPSFGQNAQKDSLQQVIYSDQHDTLKIKALLQLCWIEKDNSLDSAFVYLDQASKIARTGSFKKEQANCFYYEGILYYFLGSIDTALAYLDSSLVFYGDHEAYGKASVFNLRGLILSNQGKYKEALEAYRASMELGKQTDSKYAIANPLHNMGSVSERMSNLDQALNYYFDALEIRKEIGDSLFINQSRVAIGGVYYLKRDLENARTFLTTAIESINRETTPKDDRTLSKALSNFGLTLMESGSLDSAIYYLEKCQVIQKKLADNYSLCVSHLNLAQCYLRKEDYRKSIELAKTGMEYGEMIDAKKEISQLSRLLYEAYARMGNLDQALVYQERFLNIQDTILGEKVIDEVSKWQVQYETEKKEKELLEEREKNAIAELKLSRRRNTIILISALFILFALAFGFIYFRTRQQNQIKIANVKIREQQDRVIQILEAQEKERQKIARELHDGVVQTLGGIQIKLQYEISKKQEDDELKQINSYLNDSIKELRGISHQMMPKSLKESGLAPTLEDMLNLVFSDQKMTHSFETFGLPDKLPEDLQVNLFRIAQEVAYNAYKHSSGSHFSMQLLKTGNFILLIGEDDGKGIDLASNDEIGIGLKNIENRAQAMGGSANFESSANNGTLVTVKLPLDNAHAN